MTAPLTKAQADPLITEARALLELRTEDTQSGMLACSETSLNDLLDRNERLIAAPQPPSGGKT